MKLTTKTFIILSFFFLFSFDARAANEACRTPDGFLDNGIGGTGLEDKKKGDDGKGIGGTGAPFEAAYVSGTIYAYGSICVNGLRISYDDKTLLDGYALGDANQKPELGQVVEIYAENVGGLRAKEMRLRNEIQGPVTAIDNSGNTLHVMGTLVRLKDTKNIDSIKVGQTVYVSGARNKDGSISASLIKGSEKKLNNFVYGLLQQKQNGIFGIGNTEVKFSHNVSSAPFLGRYVRVLGAWDKNNFFVSHIESSLLPEITTNAHTYFSMEGTVDEIGPGNRVVLSGLVMHPKTMTCGGTPLEKGERVIGMGRIAPTGKILIDGFVDHEAQSTKIVIE